MTENFELGHGENKSGMKVLVSKIQEISPDGKFHLPKHLRSITKLSFKPLQVVFMPFNETSNQKKLATWLYRNFGASSEGTTYRLNYYRKVNAWSRRLTKLCWVKIWDTEIGEFKFEFVRGLGTIRRFGFFRG